MENLFGIYGDALALRAQRLHMLASNIANAATPNYKARDFDFGNAMRLVQNGISLSEAQQTESKFRTPLQPSLDGNTVELATEQTLFAANAVQYRTTISFLEGRIETIRRALKGE